MNKDRRRRLAKATPLIAEAVARMAEARAIIEEIRDEEREAFDNLSEGAQGGDQGAEMQSHLDDLESGLEAIDSISWRDVATPVSSVSDSAEIDAPAPRLTPTQIEARRLERLPQWARERLARLERDLAEGRRAAANAFAERTDDPTEIADGDYSSPTRDRILPTRRAHFPAFGITVAVERGRGGHAVTITADRPLLVRPNVSNSISVHVEER